MSRPRCRRSAGPVSWLQWRGRRSAEPVTFRRSAAVTANRVTPCGIEPLIAMDSFQHLLSLTAPLFVLVFVGYALMRWAGWPLAVSDALTQFVFSVAVPALLFRIMSGFSRLPPVDSRLLLAYFGGSLLVFAAGRVVAHAFFRMDGASQSVFAVGGIFANNVLLGVPLAKVTLGDAAMPVVSLVLVFNSLLLWTLVTVSVEWARRRDLSLAGIAKTAVDVATNPVVAGILAGTAFGFTGVVLPSVIDRTLELVAQAAVPLSLVALGMGLAEFRVRDGWRESIGDHDDEARRAAARRARARPRAGAAAARNAGHRHDGFAAGRRQRLPDGTAVRDAGRYGCRQSRHFHRPRRRDDAVVGRADRPGLTRERSRPP